MARIELTSVSKPITVQLDWLVEKDPITGRSTKLTGGGGGGAPRSGGYGGGMGSSMGGRSGGIAAGGCAGKGLGTSDGGDRSAFAARVGLTRGRAGVPDGAAR